MRRLVATPIAALAFVLAAAPPAGAHGTQEPTNYVTEITGVDGDPAGATLRILALGERVELRRTTAAEVVVIGYDGDDYLRFDEQGVWENRNSRATYLNEDRYAQVEVPATAGPNAEPDWVLVTGSDTFAWHDHRAHWMSYEPPPAVQGSRDVRQVVYEDAVRIRVDGREVVFHTRVTWVPPPPTTLWLVTIGLAGALGVVAVAWRASLAPPFALAASLLALVARPAGPLWLVLPLVGAALAAWGWHRRALPFTAGGALIAVVTAVQRFDVFSNSFLPGSVPGWVQRVGVAETVVLGAAALSAVVVDRRAVTPVPSAS